MFDAVTDDIVNVEKFAAKVAIADELVFPIRVVEY